MCRGPDALSIGTYVNQLMKSSRGGPIMDASLNGEAARVWPGRRRFRSRGAAVHRRAIGECRAGTRIHIEGCKRHCRRWTLGEGSAKLPSGMRTRGRSWR